MAEKKSCQVFVVTVGGKRYLYGDGPDDPYTWAWDGDLLSVYHGTDEELISLRAQGKAYPKCVFQSTSAHVLAVGGPETFFQDAWWAKE